MNGKQKVNRKQYRLRIYAVIPIDDTPARRGNTPQIEALNPLMIVEDHPCYPHDY